MTIEKVNEYYETGVLTDLMNSGFLSPKILMYRQIYLWVDLQQKTRNINKTKAALEAEIQFKLSKYTIWLALRTFK